MYGVYMNLIFGNGDS